MRNKDEQIEVLKNSLYHEKLMNKLLYAENEELKKVIYGMKEYQMNYIRFFPYIDRLRRTYIYRGLRKIKRIISRGNHE